VLETSALRNEKMDLMGIASPEKISVKLQEMLEICEDFSENLSIVVLESSLRCMREQRVTVGH
jgi:hypothetical protein